MRRLPSSYRLAGLGFLVAVAYAPGLFTASFMPRWWLIAIGVPLICELRPFQGDSRLPLLTAMGLVWAAAAIAVSGYAQGGVLPLAMLLMLAGVAWAANSVDDLEPALTAFSWGIAVSAAICVLQVLGWSGLPMNTYPGGLFYNSEVMAEAAAPVLVWALISRRWALAAVLVAPLALCHSRIAVLTAALGLLYAWQPSRRWMKPAACAAIALLFAAALTTMGLSKFASGLTRLVLWIAAGYSITPLGQGLGWWASAHPFGYEEFVHSDALQLLVEVGIGGLLFIAIPVLIFRNGIADRAMGACFAALCFQGLVSFPIHFPASGFLLALLAGHLARRSARVGLPELQGRADPGADLRRAATHGAGMARCGTGHGGRVWDRPAHPPGARPDPARGDGGLAIAGSV